MGTSFQQINQIVGDDKTLVDQLLAKQLACDVPLASEMSEYLMMSAGKRIRPLVTLLCARMYQCQDKKYVSLACALEFLHNAALLHDDVIDCSLQRRGQKTANAIWGNLPSVLSGDFLYSRAFQLLVDVGDIRILAQLSQVTNLIALGEMMQCNQTLNVETTETDYMEMIRRKTAILFEAAASAVGYLVETGAQTQQKLADYGLALGYAFQLIDDMLDYSGDSTVMGKNIGDDLAQGKMTLPLIYALKNGTPQARQQILQVIDRRQVEDMPVVCEILQESHALDYTLQCAQNYRDKALQALEHFPQNEYRQGLATMADLVVSRQS